MRLVHVVCLAFLAACFAACIEQPLPDLTPQARVVAAWDPLLCGDPHRVVVELEDELGVPASRSVPCELGGVSVDLAHWGVYRGRIYAWEIGPEIRSVLSVRLEVDAPIIHWFVDTPR